MAIYRGDVELNPKHILIGERHIAKVYAGDTLVWSKDYEDTAKYGFLYNLYAVQDTREIAPYGWKVPSLQDFLDMFGLLTAQSDGGKLKGLAVEPDDHPRWNAPNEGATNEFDFDGYGGGYREDDGTFDFLGFRGYWWTSDGYYFGLSNDRSEYFYSNDFDPRYGLSVRFIKEDSDIGDGTVTDNDGNVYSTVDIGGAIWTKENVRTTSFRANPTTLAYEDYVESLGGYIEDFSLLDEYISFISEYEESLSIPNIVEDLEWKGMEDPAYCIYDYNIEKKDIFHNKLKGLQGGIEPDEYYHLTAEEYEKVKSGSLGGITIPTPKIKIKKSGLGDGTPPAIDRVYLTWQQDDLTFLDHNPQIWLFRQKNYKKKGSYRKKKWTHEPHLNGINFPLSAFWNGTTSSPFASIEATGRETEWALDDSVREQEIPISFFDYFYGVIYSGGGGKVLLSESYDYVTNPINVIQVHGKKIKKFSVSLGGGASKINNQAFRVAIVIDNPNQDDPNPVLIGDFSDIFIANPVVKYYSGDIEKVAWVYNFDKKIVLT